MKKLPDKLDDVSYDTYRRWLQEVSYKKKLLLECRANATNLRNKYLKYLHEWQKNDTREKELEQEIINVVPAKY